MVNPRPIDVLPHRPPFLFVTAVDSVDPGAGATGRWELTGEEPFFSGHFPGRPTLPGVLMVESLAQLGGIAVLLDPRYAGKLPLFGGIERARFRRQVVPGDTLELAVTMDRMSARAGKGHGTATVNGERACEADLLFVIVDADVDADTGTGGRLMRLATWNVNSLTARLPRVTEWIGLHAPDVMCLQETKQSDDSFPFDTFSELGYQSVHHGDGRWNGVALISRVGLDDPVRGFGTPEDEHGSRIVAATCGGVRVHSVYVPNGRSLDNEFYGIKLAWLARLRTMLDETCRPGDPVVIGGDFNVAPTDTDVWDPAQFVGQTHVSEPERDALRHVEAWGLEDVFPQFNEPGVFTWWDYRAGDFHQGRGLRIDLLLLSADLAGRATAAFRDRDARKGQKPSDHAPVVVDLAEP